MHKFLSVYPPPLPPLFFSFAESLRVRLLQQWHRQIQGQEGPHAQEIQHQQQDDMIKQLNEKVDRFRLMYVPETNRTPSSSFSPSLFFVSSLSPASSPLWSFFWLRSFDRIFLLYLQSQRRSSVLKTMVLSRRLHCASGSSVWINSLFVHFSTLGKIER